MKPGATFAMSFILGLTLAACGGSPSMNLLKKQHSDLISPQEFGICKGYGCKIYIRTGLTAAEWRRIVDIFATPAEDAAEERLLIKRAIGLFERLVGPRTGTDADDPGSRILNFSPKDQMDCIDEAFNSTTYLYLLRKAGLVHYHILGKPLRRGYFFDRWPHNTATIHQAGSEKKVGGAGHYVVDSWFHSNGREPEIIPARQWLRGWSPD